jgi:hypothetical protein
MSIIALSGMRRTEGAFRVSGVDSRMMQRNASADPSIGAIVEPGWLSTVKKLSGRTTRHAKPEDSMPDTQQSQGHRGAVRNPQTDGRLKHNRGNGVAKTQNARANIQHGGQGRVKNPGTDRRLKHNR